MLSLTEEDLAQLRQWLAAKRPPWNQWECKLHAGNILILEPVIPLNPRTRKPDPRYRSLTKRLRIVSSIPGPFRLEYWRHTEQWWPLDCRGDLKEIMRCIESREMVPP
jgi:hypothetical protein